MTLGTITIESVDYTSYASLVEADRYLAVDPVRAATWEALEDDDKGRKLVSATRRLDLLGWQGEKTGGDDTQENAWPRTGLVFGDGTTVPDADVPQEVENAVILLAGSIAITATDSESGTSGSNKKRLKAGSAEIEFFRPETGKVLQDESAFALVQQWLEGGVQAGAGNKASGCDEESSFEDSNKFGLTRAYP